MSVPSRRRPGARDFADVVASSVHDIKNSISLLLGSAEALQAEFPAASAGRRHALALQQEARRINYDLTHLLGLFRLERMHHAVHPQVVDCEELLEEIAAYNRGLFASRELNLALDCRPGAEGFFDRELVLGVLNSTLNNAFRHARARVALGCEVIDGYTVFALLDDGAGYGPKILKGRDAGAGAEYRCGDTGLGLYFARRIAALHRHRRRIGRVELSNRGFDGGGRFELWLP